MNIEKYGETELQQTDKSRQAHGMKPNRRGPVCAGVLKSANERYKQNKTRDTARCV